MTGTRRSRIVAWSRTAIAGTCIGAVLLLAGAALVAHATGRDPAPVSGQSTEQYALPPPPFSEGIFPCMDCHDGMEPDFTVRKVSAHEDIALDHGPRERWCFDCHDPVNRNQLRLASGSTVPFTESYLLCGQCHGDKLRDWKVGVHGKRTGKWSGKKDYLLCAHCHNPHSPAFEPIEPLPPPEPPARLHGKKKLHGD